MAFDINFFQPVGGQSRRANTNYAAGLANATVRGAPAVWSYKTVDAHATVDGADYFLSIRSLLEIGDVIWVAVVDSSGVLQTYGHHAVKDKSATSVDVTNVTVGVMTDTD